MCERVDLLPGTDQRVFVDIDSLLRPVYGYAKQGGSYGHTKIAGKQVLRKGLSPLAATISTAGAAPVIAGIRLRAGKTGSGKGAGRMVASAIGTARAAGAHGQILVRGDSAYGSHAVVAACVRHGAQFSLVMTRNTAIERAITGIEEAAWTPVCYPGAVRNPDTGAWISDAEVAEIPYTAFASSTDRITARLVVRRVKDARYRDALFPVWRYHPFFTNTDLPVDQADITHRQHAIIETVFADLIDGPLAHSPEGRFGANSAWVLCAAIAHNLPRATGMLAGDQHTRARGSTLRRTIINIPARLACPQRRPILHLPRHWPWPTPWLLPAAWDHRLATDRTTRHGFHAPGCAAAGHHVAGPKNVQAQGDTVWQPRIQDTMSGKLNSTTEFVGSQTLRRAASRRTIIPNRHCQNTLGARHEQGAFPGES